VGVNGYPDYFISPKGIVYKGDKAVRLIRKKGKSIKVKLRLDSWPAKQYKWYGLATLLAEHFIPNPKKCKKIIFKDRNNQNCVMENIAWVDGETFVFYSGLNQAATKRKKIVLDRYEAAKVCTDMYLKKYYETLDEMWLQECWAVVEKEMTDFKNWHNYRSETYLYFMDRAKRFSLVRKPTGLLRIYMKGLKVALYKEISCHLPLGKMVQVDESLRNIQSADDYRQVKCG
jgi:hypothetical protein